MIKRAIKLSEFGIKYEARVTLKAQSLADFIVEMKSDVPIENVDMLWTNHLIVKATKLA